MNQSPIPPVTEDDILLGQKSILLTDRRGNKVPLVVRPLPWRQAMAQADDLKSSDRMIGVLEHCLDRSVVTDQVLDTLWPLDVIALTRVANQLTMGLPDDKKKPEPERRLQAAEKAEPSNPSTAPKAT